MAASQCLMPPKMGVVVIMNGRVAAAANPSSSRPGEDKRRWAKSASFFASAAASSATVGSGRVSASSASGYSTGKGGARKRWPRYHHA